MHQCLLGGYLRILTLYSLYIVNCSEDCEIFIELFARYGIPEEILTDKEQTLHLHVGRCCTDLLELERYGPPRRRKRNWDRMIYHAHVLFACRKVPQATLGFSHFELLYGCEVRASLDVLKEEWIQNHETETHLS